MNQTRSKAKVWITQLQERLKIIKKHGSLANAKKAGDNTFTYTFVLVKELMTGDIIKHDRVTYRVKSVTPKPRSITLVVERVTKTGNRNMTVLCLAPTSEILRRI